MIAPGKFPIKFAFKKEFKEQLKNIGLDENFKIQIVSSKNTELREKYTKHLYKKLQRSGLIVCVVSFLIKVMKRKN